VYQVENAGQALRSRAQLMATHLFAPRVSRTVLMLGLTSLFTDISSEMVSTILPLYLLFHLGLTPVAFGVVDGLQQGAAALVRIFGGAAADRLGRHKEVAVVGYALSAVARIGLLVVGNVWSLLSGVVLVDRLGKGIRTGPRDALISLSSPREELGVAFGVHRALDTAGAMMGPLFAFVYLTLQRRVAFDPKFLPLLYVATATVFMLTAVPVGRLADRLGRAWVFLAGHAVLLVVYASLLVPGAGTLRMMVALVLLGVYYAATDGVLMALAGAALPQEMRASGMSLLATGTNLARLAGSILFGVLWTWQGVGVAVALSTAGLAAALLVAVCWLRVR
jgi:MFS family permease